MEDKIEQEKCRIGGLSRVDLVMEYLDTFTTSQLMELAFEYVYADDMVMNDDILREALFEEL